MDTNNKPVYRESIVEDKLTKSRSLYDAGPFEIFWRNFLSGLSKTIGALFVYIVFIIIAGILFLRFVLPVFQPMINKLIGLIDSAQKIQQIQIPSQISFPKEIPSSIFQNK